MRASDTVSILESAWLQFPIATMLRRNVDDRIITAFVRKTVETMHDLEPALVYLSQPFPEKGMRQLFESRGMAWGLLHVAGAETSAFARSRGLSGVDALMRYSREHNALAEALAADAGMPTLTVDPRSGDWPARRGSIARFLGLADDVTGPADAGDPGRFVGTYQGGGIRFSIALRDGVPVVDGLLWFRNRLLPVAPNVVEAESWPFVLSFREGPDGVVAGVRIDGPVIPSLRRIAGSYDKTR
jgi:hypothetical protein